MSGPPPSFETAVAAAAGVRNAADAALVDLVAEALQQGWWEGAGIHTPVQWLMWKAGLSRASAARIVRLARRAAELPTVMTTFRSGGLSLDQAATVARYTPAEYEASVAEVAVNATVPQIVTATRQYEWDAEVAERDAEDTAEDTAQPTRPAQPVRRGPERSVSFGTTASDQWRASIRLPADEGSIVEAALRTARDRLHDARRTAARERAAAALSVTGAPGRNASGGDAPGRNASPAEPSPAGPSTADGPGPGTGARPLSDRELGVEPVSWADALLGVAHSVLGHTAGGAEVSSRPGVLLHLQAPVDGADHWRAEVHMGPALPDTLRRYLLCDADISTVWHTDGHPVQVGRTHRIVPRRIRRLVEHRDGGCRVPGCDSSLWVQVHHIVHWEDHGETVTWNLICLCAHHHRLHHQGRLGITGNADLPDGVVFTAATGMVLRPAGTPTVPPGPEAMPTVAPYDGPTGERLHRACVAFTRRREPAA